LIKVLDASPARQPAVEIEHFLGILSGHHIFRKIYRAKMFSATGPWRQPSNWSAEVTSIYMFVIPPEYKVL
jgi:hypothetical protein